MICVTGHDKAQAVADGTEFDLSAGLCTASPKHATHFRRRAEAGMVRANPPTAGVTTRCVVGCRKGSDFGLREQGSHARE